MKRMNLPRNPVIWSKSAAIHVMTAGSRTYIPTAKTARKTQNIAALALWLPLLTTPAAAQQIYFPWTSVTATQTGGTIAAGTTFQTALAANSNRKGCLIQNTSSHTMSVYAGVLASATADNSVQVAASGMWSCNYGPAVITDAINVTTSTTSDKFVVLSMQ